ncbi:hypothetical protein PROFUN_14981 [Planoprotostelium fungivorum]|uniref:Uncharacterized protein n=1 Tax=Planoprotostelium fungivorum TaxID=1890364 RepID=A0A2P6MY12_9EUKA|nr:hypothetical protein PROFUN_14981 [Planoprotostelium fungivorum]
MQQVTTNGVISTHDITRVILDTVLNEPVIQWMSSVLKSHNRRRRKQFAVLRSTCKLWKNIVDKLTDWLTDDDLVLALKSPSERLWSMASRALTKE